MERIRHEAMIANEHLKKWGEAFVPESNLWTEGEIRESGVVNSFREGRFTASPMGAGVQGEPEPAVEIIGDAGAGAARIPLQPAAQGDQCSWKFAVDCCAGIKHGVSTEQLP